MLKKHTIIWGVVLLIVILYSHSFAILQYTWTEGNYIIPDISRPMGGGAELIDTYNNVNVTMSGEGVSTFNMHDSSQFIMSGGNVGELNLYDNALASIFEDSDIHYLFVDSASTALVKLYAVEFFHPGNYDFVQGYWLNNPQSMFTIDLLNSTNPLDLGSYNTYSHIQFIPEPATLALLAVGFFAIRKRRKR